jgi:DNA-binding response OmpR family regulator
MEVAILVSPPEIEMPSSSDRTTVVFLAVLREKDELPEAVRARVALDLLASLPGEEPSVQARSSQSRLQLGAVRIPPSGRAYLVGSGDASGAAVLVWEVFAGRESPAPEERARLHDAVDEVHPDVDDVVAAALAGEHETVGSFLEALERATPRAASHFDVVASLRGSDQPAPSLRPSVPWPRPPSVAPPPSYDPLDELEIDHRAELARLSEPDAELEDEIDPPARPVGDGASPRAWPVDDTPLVLLCANDEDELLAADLRRAGFLVWAQPPGPDGVEAVALARPRCVVCDVGVDGARELVEALRGNQATRKTPMLLLAPRVDDRSSLAAFFAAADVCIEKPFRVEAVTAQVGALIQNRGQVAATSAIRGDLSLVAATTLLTLLDIEQRSGELRVDAGNRRIAVELASGHVIGAAIEGKPVTAADAIAAILREKSGSFAFTPTGARAMPPNAERLGTLLFETHETSNSGRAHHGHESPSAPRSPQ